MLPRDRSQHPGGLIITRFKAEADSLAETINTLAGWPMAAACHSDHKLSVEERQATPVLIITHEAYKIGVDLLNFDNDFAWHGFKLWRNGERKLVVIDEAISFVEETQITPQGIELALAYIPRDIKEQFHKQVALARSVQCIMEQGLQRLKELETEKKIPRLQERMLWLEAVAHQNHDRSGILQAIKEEEFEFIVGKVKSRMFRKSIRDGITNTLKGVQCLVTNWAYLARIPDRKGTVDTLNTARFILPDGVSGAVILDATAASDRVYDLFPGGCTIRHTRPARRYDNVTLRISSGHRAGKNYLTANAPKLAPKLFGTLKEAIDRDRRVLVICHKGSEPFVAKFKGDHFAAFDVAHWGALDGRNDWQDFDTVVLFGLPYPPQTHTANVFMAMQGPRDDDWLSDSTKRAFKDFSDIRNALEESHIIKSVIQGINRIRCRRVVDAQGGCEPAHIYALFPEKGMSDKIIQALRDEMPGIQVVNQQWFNEAKVSRGNNYEAALISYLGTMPRGEAAISEVRAILGASRATWERLVGSLKDPATPIGQEAIRCGVEYQVRRNGKTYYSYLVKE